MSAICRFLLASLTSLALLLAAPSARAISPVVRVLPGSWAPTWVSSCKLWLDPTRGFVAGTSWTDQIGGVVFSYTAGGGTMVAGTGINGTRTVNFTTGGYLSSSATLASVLSAGVNASTTLAIWRYTGVVADGGSGGQPYTNPGIIADSSGYWWQSCSTTKFHNGVYHASTQDDSIATTTATNYYTLSVYDAASAGKIFTGLNGAALDSGTTAGSVGGSAGTLVVAADYSHADHFVGSLGDVVVCGAKLSTVLQGQMNAWAHGRYGI